MRLRIALFSWLLVLTIAGVASAQTTTTFSVVNSGMTAYLINGASNPTLSLTRGTTYTFNVNSPGHPFFIKTAQVTGTGSAFNEGVTNNGISTGMGTTTFQVPADAPGTLFYNCSIHSAMTGTLLIADAVPATGSFATGLLAALALVAGFVMLRRQAKKPRLA
jgi:plastocyanin